MSLQGRKRQPGGRPYYQVRDDVQSSHCGFCSFPNQNGDRARGHALAFDKGPSPRCQPPHVRSVGQPVTFFQLSIELISWVPFSPVSCECARRRKRDKDRDLCPEVSCYQRLLLAVELSPIDQGRFPCATGYRRPLLDRRRAAPTCLGKQYHNETLEALLPSHLLSQSDSPTNLTTDLLLPPVTA